MQKEGRSLTQYPNGSEWSDGLCLGYAQLVFEALAEFSVDELKKMFGTEMDP